MDLREMFTVAGAKTHLSHWAHRAHRRLERTAKRIEAMLGLRAHEDRVGHQGGEPLLEQLDAMIDQTSIGLELGFTRTAHANASAEFLEVGPHAREARQCVLELRELHLHLCLTRARARREDVE